MDDAAQYALIGAVAVLAGSGYQAINELAALVPRMQELLVPQVELMDAELAVLTRGLRWWQWSTKRRLRSEVDKNGRDLFTKEERQELKSYDRKARGWSVIFAGSLMLVIGAAQAL